MRENNKPAKNGLYSTSLSSVGVMLQVAKWVLKCLFFPTYSFNLYCRQCVNTARVTTMTIYSIKRDMYLMWIGPIGVRFWPYGKLPFDCQKIAKNLTFFSKKLTKIVIFFNIGNFVDKWQFLSIFLKKKSSFWQFFDSQMAIFRRV